MPPRFKCTGTRLGLAASLAFTCFFFIVRQAAPVAAIPSTSADVPVSRLALLTEGWDTTSFASIDPEVLQLGLRAASCALRSGDVSDARTLTIIDYSRPSSEERLWVFDLETRDLLYHELVAHGQGSGENMATTFSNDEGTHASSIGLFATADTYVGKNGYSLRLQGLDRGFNDRALERAIVMHGAPYVSPTFVKAQGRLGRSWGCPALREGVVREVIDRVKGSGLLFAYYPDAEWLRMSRYLGGCEATP